MEGMDVRACMAATGGVCESRSRLPPAWQRSLCLRHRYGTAAIPTQATECLTVMDIPSADAWRAMTMWQCSAARAQMMLALDCSSEGRLMHGESLLYL